MSKEQVIEILKGLKMIHTGLLKDGNGHTGDECCGYAQAASEQNAKIQAVIDRLEGNGNT